MAAAKQLSVRSMYLPVNGNSLSPNEQADNDEDESDTSTLVGGEDIDEKTKAVVKK